MPNPEVESGVVALLVVAAGILPAVEPGFQPSGQNHSCSTGRLVILPVVDIMSAFSGRQDAALYVRQDA
jgi:hypothetical protein